eukprot:7222615-Prymnesium_polylepis.2
MVPVVMEPRCCSTVEWPDGTVKGKLAGKLYINLTDDDEAKFNDGVARLIDEIATVIGKESARAHRGAEAWEARTVWRAAWGGAHAKLWEGCAMCLARHALSLIHI